MIINQLSTAMLATLLLGLTLVGCGAQTEQQRLSLEESNTNWLRRCVSDDDCSEARSCLCGVCTTSCESAENCQNPEEPSAETLTCVTANGEMELPTGCAGQLGEEQSACIADCDEDRDCTELSADATCELGICRRPAPKKPLQTSSSSPSSSNSVTLVSCAEVCAAWPCDQNLCAEGCEESRTLADESCGVEWNTMANCVLAGAACDNGEACPAESRALTDCLNANVPEADGNGQAPFSTEDGLYVMEQKFEVEGGTEISRGGGCFSVEPGSSIESGLVPASDLDSGVSYSYNVDYTTENGGLRIKYSVDAEVVEELFLDEVLLTSGETTTVNIMLPDGVHRRYLYWGGPQCIVL